ncbi:hypothetical protein TWF481_007540 [Arthrobotrys musiformis]|uniref:Uncharacterized protein n=1 Tax=Arthrobotrys musiformis TaxID=47236 RepID=A0AAV9WE28_9PEZI
MSRDPGKAYLGVSGRNSGLPKPGKTSIQPMGQWRLDDSLPVSQRPTQPARPRARSEVASVVDFIPPSEKSIRPQRFRGVRTLVSVWDPAKKVWDRCIAENIMIFLFRDTITLEIVLPPKKGARKGSEENSYLFLSRLDWCLPKAGTRAYLKPPFPPTQTWNRMEIYGSLYLEVTGDGVLQRLPDKDTPWGAEECSMKAFATLESIQKRVREYTGSFPNSTWLRMELLSEPGLVRSTIFWRSSFYILVSKISLPCRGNHPFLSNGSPERYPPDSDEGIVTASRESDEQTESNGTNAGETDYFHDTTSTDSIDGAERYIPPRRFITSNRATKSGVSNLTPAIKRELSVDGSAFINANEPTPPDILTTPSLQPRAISNEASTEERLIVSRLADVEQELQLLQEKRKLQMKLSEIAKRNGTTAGQIPHLLD